MTGAPPTLEAIHRTRERLGTLIVETPVRLWRDLPLDRILGESTRVFLKEELFQRTGTFKPRGALSVMMDLSPKELERGVTAVSAGNHAVGVAYAARMLKTTAKVVMSKTADPFRVRSCRDWGAQVEFSDDFPKAFERVKDIVAAEGRTFVHPFEGPKTTLGLATLGLELCAQVPDLDAVIVPIGGGGLCSGIASAVKQVQPACRVYGVEPAGADAMSRSLAAGSPQSIAALTTIADSLCAPHAAPYSFGLCRRYMDELVLVDDDAIRAAMRLLFYSAKLAVEPAGAVATAGLCGPLREKVMGKRVAVIVCGSNIDAAAFCRHLTG